MGGKGKNRDEKAKKQVEWWTGEGGRRRSFVILIPPQTPSLASLANSFPLFLSLRSLFPGYYNICITHNLNIITILFLGNRNKCHVTIT